MNKNLNIVTLNIPYPPDYGGMIDSFYRLKWLDAEGVRIHLHCFQYGRETSKELEAVSETVKYYPRDTTIKNHISIIPYIVKSRGSKELLDSLLSNDFPILFDGLHTTFFLKHPDLEKRKKFVRLHNIEHLYYKSLTTNESNPGKKLYYITESQKLKYYEEALRYANQLFTISLNDNEYFKNRYINSVLISPFHPFEKTESLPGNGRYILYHGDLSVKENSRMAESLSKNVFSRIKYDCIIAGKNPPGSLSSIADVNKNIKIISDPGLDEMGNLIKDAHINLLPTTTSNGFKMKLLMALYAGRFCVVNNTAANNFSDKSLFHIAEKTEDIIDKINSLMNDEFTNEMIMNREKLLEEHFSNKLNARKIIELIFG